MNIRNKYWLWATFLVAGSFLHSQENIPCQGAPYDMVKPFMGIWEEYTIKETEEFVGKLTSIAEPDGCSISQTFESADGSFSYRSFGYVDTSTNRWKEIYVFNTGRNAVYEWFQEGEDVIMRRTGGSRKLDYMHQLRLTKISPESYDVIEEHSYDNGKNWKVIELTRTKKVEK